MYHVSCSQNLAIIYLSDAFAYLFVVSCQPVLELVFMKYLLVLLSQHYLFEHDLIRLFMPSFVKSGQRYFAKKKERGTYVFSFCHRKRSLKSQMHLYIYEHGATPFEYCQKN